MKESCEIGVIDIRTNQVAFVVTLYGYSAEEMMTVPPPISVKALLEQKGIDTTYLVSSPFLVSEVKRKSRHHRGLGRARIQSVKLCEIE